MVELKRPVKMSKKSAQRMKKELDIWQKNTQERIDELRKRGLLAAEEEM